MQNEPGRPTVHMIGNAHIDHAWLWRWLESRAEVHATCRSALDRLREFPDFVFSFSSAVSYEWIEADDPAMFAEIRTRVAEGRWNIVGGWYIQPDCNLPAGESIVRQALYAKRYFRDRFGVDVKVGYNVDSFGHAGTLPQLLAKAGIDRYVFFRPKPDEKDLPAGPFWWESPDGSRVLTCRPPLHYLSKEPDLGERVGRAIEESATSAVPDEAMCFYGVGNHGGGPTIRNIESILALQRDPTGPFPRFSTPDAYFDSALASADPTTFPVVREELQYHSVGCYSVHSGIKRLNREAEHGLMGAERLAAVADALGLVAYPLADLTEAWKLALFNQFHDTLAGTCISPVYADCREDHDRIARITSDARERAVAALAGRVDTRDLADAVFLFNPLPWRREGPIAFELHTPVDPTRLTGQNERPSGVRLTDEAGREIPCQLSAAAHTGAGYRLRLVADLGPTGLPGLGYRALGVEYLPTAETTFTAGVARAGVPVLENEHLRTSFDPATGWLTSLVDRATSAELLSGAAAVPVVLDDPSDTWSHGVAAYRDEIGRFAADGDVALVEHGPLRSAVRVRARWGESLVEQVFSLAAGARQVEVAVRVDWREQWRALKLAFPFALRDAVATAETPYGSASRPTGGHEESMQRWLDVTGSAADGSLLGVAVLNDGKCAYDVLGAEARLTVLRSPAYAFHQPRVIEPDVEYEYVDQGEQRFHYAIRPHRGALAEAGISRAAWELNEAVVVHREPAHPGDKRAARAFLDVSPASVLASVVKRAESGDGSVLRLVETAGRTTSARLAFAGWGPDDTVEVTLNPYEAKSLRWSSGGLAEVDLLEGA